MKYVVAVGPDCTACLCKTIKDPFLSFPLRYSPFFSKASTGAEENIRLNMFWLVPWGFLTPFSLRLTPTSKPVYFYVSLKSLKAFSPGCVTHQCVTVPQRRPGENMARGAALLSKHRALSVPVLSEEQPGLESVHIPLFQDVC